MSVDHATINRWVLKDSPPLEAAFHRRKRPVRVSWRMAETYVKINGQGYFLYRAVDKSGQTIDCLRTEHRDEQAATRFLTRAIRCHGVPGTITIDGSEANAAAIRGYNEAHGTAIIIRQVKYLNTIVEQDHRSVKRLTRPMLGFKAFDAAQCTLTGIALMRMLLSPHRRQGNRLIVAFDTDGEVIFAAASTLTHPVFTGLPNMGRVYF